MANARLLQVTKSEKRPLVGHAQARPITGGCSELDVTRERRVKTRLDVGGKALARPSLVSSELCSLVTAHPPTFPHLPISMSVKARFCHAADPLLSRSSSVSIVPIVILNSASSAVWLAVI